MMRRDPTSLSIVGCFTEGPRKIIMYFRTPCTFEQVLEMLNDYQAPGKITLDANYAEGIVMASVEFEGSRIRVADLAESLNDSVESSGVLALPPPEPQETLDWGKSEDVPEGVPEDEDPEKDADVVVLGEIPDVPTPAVPPSSQVLRRPHAEAQANNVAQQASQEVPAAAQTTSKPRNVVVTTDKGKTYYAPTCWNPYAIRIRVPYGWDYEDFVVHFTQFGAIDYATFEEISKGRTKKENWIGCVRYQLAASCREAYYNSPDWSPWRTYPTRKNQPKALCDICGDQFTAAFRADHIKLCATIKRLQPRIDAARKLRENSPQPNKEAQAAKWEAPREQVPTPLEERLNRQRQQGATPKNKATPQGSGEKKVTFKDVTTSQAPADSKESGSHICPPAMAKGPLVGTRLGRGFIQVFTHKVQALTIQDEGQTLVTPNYPALEKQLRKIYGTCEEELP